MKNGKLDSSISLDCQIKPDPSVWLSAARVLIQVVFIISSSRLSCCFLSSADEADRHCWRPQVHHRVEFRNSRSSARFLSRCDKYERKRLEPKKIIHWLNKKKAHSSAYRGSKEVRLPVCLSLTSLLSSLSSSLKSCCICLFSCPSSTARETK